MTVCSGTEKAVKQLWTEHQDEELKTLFDEFHHLPQDTAAEHGLLCFSFSCVATYFLFSSFLREKEGRAVEVVPGI